MSDFELTEDDYTRLKKLASWVDAGATESERTNAKSLFIKKLMDVGLTAGQIVSSLEHYQGRKDIDNTLTELTQMAETLAGLVEEKEAELAENVDIIAKLEDENKALRANGHVAPPPQPQAQPSSAPVNDLEKAALLARVAQMEKSLQETGAKLTATETGLKNMAKELDSERRARAEITTAYEEKSARDAALFRQAMETLLPKIMEPVKATVPPPSSPVLSSIQSYFINASTHIDEISKFRSEIDFLMETMANALNISLHTRRIETATFMRHSIGHSKSHGEMNIYKLGNITFGLLINGQDNWCFKDHEADLSAYFDSIGEMYSFGSSSGLPKAALREKSGYLGWPSVDLHSNGVLYNGASTLDPIVNQKNLSIEPIAKKVIPMLIGNSVELNSLRAVLRPMGLVI